MGWAGLRGFDEVFGLVFFFFCFTLGYLEEVSLKGDGLGVLRWVAKGWGGMGWNGMGWNGMGWMLEGFVVVVVVVVVIVIVAWEWRRCQGKEDTRADSSNLDDCF